MEHSIMFFNAPDSLLGTINSLAREVEVEVIHVSGLADVGDLERKPDRPLRNVCALAGFMSATNSSELKTLTEYLTTRYPAGKLVSVAIIDQDLVLGKNNHLVTALELPGCLYIHREAPREEAGEDISDFLLRLEDFYRGILKQMADALKKEANREETSTVARYLLELARSQKGAHQFCDELRKMKLEMDDHSWVAWDPRATDGKYIVNASVTRIMLLEDLEQNKPDKKHMYRTARIGHLMAVSGATQTPTQ